MKIHRVEEPEDCRAAAERIESAPVLGLDTETTGFTPRVGEISLLQIAITPEEVYVFDVRRLREKGAELTFVERALASDQVVVMQNAKFDLAFLEKLIGHRVLVKNLNDTMLASILLAFGDKTQRHSLGVISERELGEPIDKSLQSSDFSVRTFSEEQIAYAADDAARLLRIREVQGEKISSAGLRRCARLEFDAVQALVEMETTGMYIDTASWDRRTIKQRARHTELDAELKAAIAPVWPVMLLWGEPDINLASPSQLKQALNLLGIPVESTDEDDLKLFKRTHPLMETVLEYRYLETALKKFGENYSRFIDPTTHRVHASYRQIEAPTGRMSCTDPNLMQVPARGPYRSSFTAEREGGKIITADYSQIELRIMAQLSGDRLMTEAFVAGEDLHNKTAHLVLGEPLENPDKDRRVVAKNLNFGTAYGTSPGTFANLAGTTESEAETLIKTFWRTYAGLDAYLREQGRIAQETGVMKTASGRTGRLKLDMSIRSNQGRANRLGRNFSIQGTGADIVKTALYFLRKRSIVEDLDLRLINVVHDEIVCESYGNHEYNAEVVREEMISAAAVYLETIPVLVDVRLADCWSK